MILFVDEDERRRKQLCDMLSRERILPVSSRQQVLEALVYHKDKLNAIIADARSGLAILSDKTITQLCSKLSIVLPPLVIFYQKQESSLMEEIRTKNYACTYVLYDKKDVDFPPRYIKAVKKVYEKLSVDMMKANEIWLKGETTHDLVDIRAWLQEEGFVDKKKIVAQPTTPERKCVKDGPDRMDYRKLYVALKEEYARLKEKYNKLRKSIEKRGGSV